MQKLQINYSVKLLLSAANGPTLPEADPIIYKENFGYSRYFGKLWRCLYFIPRVGATTWDIIGPLMRLQTKWKNITKGFKDAYAL